MRTVRRSCSGSSSWSFFASLIAVVISFAGSSILATSQLTSQRDTIYTENGAIDAAITRVRNDTTKTLGANGTDCGQQVPASGSTTVSVTCTAQASSGLPQGSTQAPGFAILSLSPYHGPNPNNGCVNVNNELGLVQVQSKKLLQINGNVYINADIDSDLWSGGCPQITTAQHPLVNGNAIHRESANDLDCAAGFTCAQPVPNPTPAQAALLADPAIANPGAWSPGVDANLTTPPPVQAVPSCGAGSLVTLHPGHLQRRDGVQRADERLVPEQALLLRSRATTTSTSRNSGTHEWSINDVTARVVGGQAVQRREHRLRHRRSDDLEADDRDTVERIVAFTNQSNANVDRRQRCHGDHQRRRDGEHVALGVRDDPGCRPFPANAVVNNVRVRVAHAESGADADPGDGAQPDRDADDRGDERHDRLHDARDRSP